MRNCNHNCRGFVISAFPLGAMITALTVGFVADLLGRKWAMLLNNAFAVLAAALMFMAPQPKIYNYWYLIAGRFVIGLNAGLFLLLICPSKTSLQIFKASTVASHQCT
jgi:MFS family permease